MTNTTMAAAPAEQSLCELDGKLALCHGSYHAWDKAEHITHYSVSTLRVDGFSYVLGLHIWAPNPGYGVVVLANGSHLGIDFHDWEQTTIRRPIDKPKDKTENTWAWSCGSWSPEWFPTCGECRKAHNPTWEDHCDWCGRALKAAQSPKAGTRCAKCTREHGKGE